MPTLRRQRDQHRRQRNRHRSHSFQSSRSSHQNDQKPRRSHGMRRNTKPDYYSSGSELTGSSFSGTYSGSDSGSFTDSISRSGSLSGDYESDSLSGSSYTTPSSDPSSDSGESTEISDDSREINNNNNNNNENGSGSNVKHNPNASRLAMAAALALQRRKKESPKLRATFEQKKVREVDHDVNPTKLCKYLEKSMWREAAERCRTSPIDARTWIFRRKEGGGLMWRVLPIHTAILYKAPVYVLVDLLDANPDGPSEPDDRNMLPLHLACRIICKEDVLRLLLKHKPSTIFATDLKGRTPIKLLKEHKKDKTQTRAIQKENAKNRKQLMHVLEDCKRQIEEGILSIDDAPERKFKSSASVCSRNSKMSAHPQVRMRQKNFGNIGKSTDRPISNNRMDLNPMKNHAPAPVHSVSNDSSTFMDRPRRNDRGNNEGKGDQHKTAVNNRNRSADENNIEVRDDLNTRSLHSHTSNGNYEQPDEASSMHEGLQVSKNDIVQGEKPLELEVDANENMNGNDDFSSSPSEEYQEFESLTTFWTEVEGQHDLVDEVPFQDSQRILRVEQDQQQKSKRENTKPLKFYEPPTELQKLLKIIHEDGEPRETYGSPMTNVQGNARRINACGALKALANKEKNRLRLARTKSVVSSICYMIIDPNSSKEERIRCSETLLALCVPRLNWGAVTAIYGDILDNFRYILEIYDSKILYNVCCSLFLLTKLEKNRRAVCANLRLVDAMLHVLTTPIREDDGTSNKVDGTFGSPSDIASPGSSTSNNETQRGSRMCILQTFLSIAKIQGNAREIARDINFINATTNLLGTMAPKENLLCMAILTNLTRHKENCEYLMREHPDFFPTILKIANSTDTECKKCAILALLNLSCDKMCRKNFIKYPEGLPIISKIASENESDHDSRVAALHTIKNLCNEPSYMNSLLESQVVLATLCATAKSKKKPEYQLIASDGLATMAQWLYTSAETCISKNNIDVGDRRLGSMSCTWDQWH